MCCLGLAVIGTWLNLTGRQLVFVPPLSLATKNLFYIGRILIFSLFIIAPDFFERHELTIARIAGLAISAGTALCVAAYSLGINEPELVRYVGYFICGLAYHCFIVPLYVSLAKTYGLKQAVIVVTLSFILRTAISLLVWDFVAIDLLRILVVLIPLFALVFVPYQKGLAHLPRKKLAATKLQGTANNYILLLGITASATLIMLQIVSKVGFVGMAGLASNPSRAYASTLGSPVTCIVLAALSYFTLIARRQKQLLTHYLWAFFAIALAMLLALALEYTETESIALLLEECLIGVEFFGHVLLWTIVMDAVQNCHTAAYRCAGIIPIFPNLINIFLNSEIIDNITYSNSIFALIIGYLIIILVLVVMPSVAKRQMSFAIEESPEDNQGLIAGEPNANDLASIAILNQSLQTRCEHLIKNYHLTPREGDVFYLLAQGRNRTIIKEQLSISESTAKTHIAHIYEKLTISSHQELIDIVYLTQQIPSNLE